MLRKKWKKITRFIRVSGNFMKCITNNGSKSRDQFVSTEFCHSQFKSIQVNLSINSFPPNLITCNISQIVSAEFYHLQYNLIRISISLHKRVTWKQVVQIQLYILYGWVTNGLWEHRTQAVIIHQAVITNKMKTFIILLGLASFLSPFTFGQAKSIKAGE